MSVTVTRRVRWWRCGAVWVSTLHAWSGDGFRAAYRVEGLPACRRWRWHQRVGLSEGHATAGKRECRSPSPPSLRGGRSE